MFTFKITVKYPAEAKLLSFLSPLLILLLVPHVAHLPFPSLLFRPLPLLVSTCRPLPKKPRVAGGRGPGGTTGKLLNRCAQKRLSKWTLHSTIYDSYLCL